MHPLLLTGPPAAGKSTTARAVAALRPRAAVIDVDDIRLLVVSGHAAPWQGDEGRLQQRVGVENACDLANRLESAEFDVVRWPYYKMSSGNFISWQLHHLTASMCLL